MPADRIEQHAARLYALDDLSLSRNIMLPFIASSKLKRHFQKGLLKVKGSPFAFRATVTLHSPGLRLSSGEKIRVVSCR